jgi:hypothetical protein
MKKTNRNGGQMNEFVAVNQSYAPCCGGTRPAIYKFGY